MPPPYLLEHCRFYRSEKRKDAVSSHRPLGPANVSFAAHYAGRQPICVIVAAVDGVSLYRPTSPLAGYAEIVGHWQGSVGYRSRALPRGAVTVIVDVGQRQRVDFYAADGRTRLEVPPAFVTGSHTASYVSEMPANEPAMAIHFRPGGALPFFGIPLGELENRYVGLDDIWGRAGIELQERLIDAPTVAARFGIVESFLLSRPWSSVRRHSAVAGALAAIEANPSIRMAEIRDLAGITTKRLIALFRAEVGLSPKAYARIRRMQAALRLLGSMNGAQVAAEVGYFDQAHFVREFRSFTGMTPTQYTQQLLVLPGHVPVVQRHKYPRPVDRAVP
jgi:AraC-like DNA-binding protein